MLVAIVMLRAFAGCARPTSAAYQEAWDGQASEWEVPPLCQVTAPEVDTQLTGDGGMTSPSNAFGQGVCKDVMSRSSIAVVELFDELLPFKIAGADYTAKFPIYPNGNVTAYYIVIQKTF